MNNIVTNILVIDDDPDILDAIKLMLEYDGYQVNTSEKAEYIEQLHNTSKLPQLIILDMLLSGKDGRVVCQQLKKDQQTKHIPVIMISAHPGAEKSTKEAGADDFIEKPFDMDTLLEKVKQILIRNSGGN